MKRDASRLEPMFAPWMTEALDNMAEERGCTCEPFLVRWEDRRNEGRRVEMGDGVSYVWGPSHGMTLCHADDCPCEPHADQAAP